MEACPHLHENELYLKFMENSNIWWKDSIYGVLKIHSIPYQ